MIEFLLSMQMHTNERPPITATVAEVDRSVLPDLTIGKRPVERIGGTMDIWRGDEHMGQMSFNGERVRGRWADVLYDIANGGPNAPTSLHHGFGIGGVRTVLHDDSGRVKPGGWDSATETNLLTPLTKGDLIRTDPFGTGKSWCKDRQWGFTSSNDVAAGAAVTLAFNAMEASPAPNVIGVYSSWATYRAGRILHYLKAGLHVPSMVVLGGSYDTRLTRYEQSVETLDSYALRLPVMAMIAQAHGAPGIGKRQQELSADQLFKEATAFALEDYAPIMRKGHLSAQARARLLDEYVAYTGLDRNFVDQRNLFVSPTDFRYNLFPGRIISAIDGTYSRWAKSERIDVLIDEWEMAYLALMRMGIQKGYFPQSFSKDYGGIIQVGQEWQYDGIWSQRRMHESMTQIIAANPNMCIVDVSGIYDIIRGGIMSRNFWRQIQERTGMPLYEYSLNEVPHGASLDNIQLGRGVHSYLLAMGHQAIPPNNELGLRDERASFQLAGLLRSLGEMAIAKQKSSR